MKRDSIYYQIFKRFPALLFELVDDRPQQAQNYRFESVEVKETAFRIDGVFLPPLDATPKIIFFAEVQFQDDETLYHRFFTELMIYLYRNRFQCDDWRGVVIFPSRQLEPTTTHLHRSLLNSDQVQRIYLDELGDPNQQPLGINLMQLTITPEAQLVELAKQVIRRTEQEVANIPVKNEIMEIVTTIAVYKFRALSREEVEAMLGITLQETRVYQEAKAEGREEQKVEMLRAFVPLLLSTGMSVEEIAQQLKIDVEEIERATQQNM